MENFTVYWNDEKTAYVDCRTNPIKVIRFVKHPVKQIFAKDELTRFELGDVLKSRCWDENRANINLYLEKMGLDEFNPYEICRKTHGVMFGSKIWFCFDGEELCAKDVLMEG